MLDNSKGRIFLAGDRSHTETATCRRYDSFGGKPAFGSLYAVTDETLAGGATCTQAPDRATRIVLLPVVGVLQYRDSLGQESLVAPGEVQEITVPAGTSIELSNPYEAALVNFLQLRFAAPHPVKAMPAPVAFDMAGHPGELMALPLDAGAAMAPGLWIGKFGGRQEVVHPLDGAENGAFVFVLQGAFETQYRLLEARDGLALWDTQAVEIEALSNDAILLLVTLQAAPGADAMAPAAAAAAFSWL